MNKKVYARQIAPEYQESQLTYNDYPEGVILDGNRQYNRHTTPAYDAIKESLDNAAGDVADIRGNRAGWYANTTEYFNDVFTPEHKDGYSTKEIAHWKRIAEEYQTARSGEESTLICQALYLMTGKQYDFAIIRGCCQSEWQECYYPVQFNPFFIETFETEYFNTGTEWILHDEEDAPESPEDISGYSMYCYSYNPIEEIAREAGTMPENVTLYQFDGYSQVARYALMEG